MGLLGKLFAIFNVLAAIGFFVVATLDYGARQSWEMAVTQQDFVLNGIPVDEKQQDDEGQVLETVLGKGMADRLFAGVGSPVTNQKAAVTQRYTDRKTYILEPADEAERRKRLETVSLPLVRTWGDRDLLRTSIRNLAEDRAKILTVAVLLDPEQLQQVLGNEPDVQKKAYLTDLARAAGIFTQECSQAVNGRNAVGQAYNLDEWRQQIAFVLVGLAGDDSQQRHRAVIISGLIAYTQEVNKQAANLAAMLPSLQQAEAEDQAAFVAKYRELLREHEYLTDRIREVEASNEQQLARKRDHQGQVDKRAADVKAQEDQIKVAQAATKVAVDRQTTLEKELFDAQKKVRDANKANQELQKEIRAKELGGTEGGKQA
jgi:hypothetical protein